MEGEKTIEATINTLAMTAIVSKAINTQKASMTGAWISWQKGYAIIDCWHQDSQIHTR